MELKLSSPIRCVCLFVCAIFNGWWTVHIVCLCVCMIYPERIAHLNMTVVFICRYIFRYTMHKHTHNRQCIYLSVSSFSCLFFRLLLALPASWVRKNHSAFGCGYFFFWFWLPPPPSSPTNTITFDAAAAAAVVSLLCIVSENDAFCLCSNFMCRIIILVSLHKSDRLYTVPN